MVCESKAIRAEAEAFSACMGSAGVACSNNRDYLPCLLLRRRATASGEVTLSRVEQMGIR